MANKIKDVTVRFKTETDEIRRADSQFDQLNKKVSDFDKKGTQAATNVGNSFRSIAGAFGLVTTIEAAISGLVSFSKEAVALAAKGEGIRTAFKKSFDNVEASLEKLRKATRGAVTDIDLMARALQAKNFGIGVDTLAKGLEFAGKVARQTGQDVNYLADSIVTGIGRKSPLILDNLGISAIALQEEVKKLGGDFEQAVGNIINKRLAEMGDVAETSADKVDKMKVSIANFQESLGTGFIEAIIAAKKAMDTLFGGGEDVANLEARNKSLQDHEKRIQHVKRVYAELSNEQLEAQKKYAQEQLKAQEAEQSIAKNNMARQDEITQRTLLTVAEIEAIDQMIKKREDDLIASKTLSAEEIKALEEAAEEREKIRLEEAKHKEEILRKEIEDNAKAFDTLNKLRFEALKIAQQRELLEVESGSDEELDLKIKHIEQIAEYRISTEVDNVQDEINIRNQAENDILALRVKYDDDFAKEKAKNDEELYKDQLKKAKDAIDLEFEYRKQALDNTLALTNEFLNATAEVLSNNAEAQETQFDLAQEKKLERIDKLLDAENISEQQRAQLLNEREAIEDDYEKHKLELRRQELRREKAAAILNVAMNTIESVAKIKLQAAVLAANPATLAYVPITLSQIPIAIGVGALQAAAILSQPVPFAKGVIDLQKGRGGVDDVPAILMRGESVMTTDETREHKDLFNAIRNDYFEKYIADNYIQPTMEKFIHVGDSTAGNIAKSIELNFDEYKVGRIFRRNNKVIVENMPSGGIGESEYRMRSRRGLNG